MHILNILSHAAQCFRLLLFYPDAEPELPGCMQGRSERLMNGGVQLKNFRIAWNISEQNSSQYLV